MLDYDKITDEVDEDVARKAFDYARSSGDFRLSPEYALDAAEQMLDLQSGVLNNIQMYVEAQNCSSCGKELAIDDIVKTAIMGGSHDKNFIVRTLLGRKRLAGSPSKLTCAKCGTQQTMGTSYTTVIYHCQETTN